MLIWHFGPPISTTAHMSCQRRALVVGGGVAGLATAGQLAKEGLKAALLSHDLMYQTPRHYGSIVCTSIQIYIDIIHTRSCRIDIIKSLSFVGDLCFGRVFLCQGYRSF